MKVSQKNRRLFYFPLLLVVVNIFFYKPSTTDYKPLKTNTCCRSHLVSVSLSLSLSLQYHYCWKKGEVTGIGLIVGEVLQLFLLF